MLQYVFSFITIIGVIAGRLFLVGDGFNKVVSEIVCKRQYHDEGQRSSKRMAS